MANKKITELTDLPSPAGADIMAIVDDVAGTPTTKKVTVDNLLSLAPTVNTGTAANLPSSPSVGDIYLETDTGILRWWDGTNWNTFIEDSQFNPTFAADQLSYSGGLYTSSDYNISTQPIMHFDATFLDGADNANNPSSGTAVSTWGDRSGQAINYDATQGTGSAQPTFTISGNDKYVSFDGGDVMLLANTYNRASGNPWTIVMVGNGSTTSSNYYAAPNEDGGGSIQLGYYGPLEDIYPGPFVNNIDLTSLNMLTYSRDGSNSLKAHRDGGTLLGSRTQATTFVHEGIGRSGTTYTTGRIYECMLFDQILSTTDLNTINSYLSNKYSGLPSLATWS